MTTFTNVWALNELSDDLYLHNKNSSTFILEELEETENDEVFANLALTDLKTMRENAVINSKSLRRAKNNSRATSICEEGRFGSSNFGGPSFSVSASRSKKNMRKARSGMGRGLPKKDGAGGKGTWGKLGCELDIPQCDRNDPNYDESEQEDSSLKVIVPMLSETDVRKQVEPLILEFYENADSSEVVYSLEEMLLNIGDNRWVIVAVIIELALDHKPSHREMSSALISDLYSKVISQRDIGKAYDCLLGQLPDLALDTPEADVILGNFIARTIADDCLPPKFIKMYKGMASNELAAAALYRAETYTTMKNGFAYLDNIWGVGGGIRPVKQLVKKIIMLLKEYLSSCDIEEAARCLQELEVPHFHHELVYEAVVIVIESMQDKTEENMCKLLKYLFRSFVITIDQMRSGFERIFDAMPELALDVPAAYSILERFCTRCRENGVLTDELYRKMPSRGRKRFVSEGDGSRLKSSW